MFCLTCTIISSVDLTHYGVFRAKDGVFVDSSTNAEFFFSDFEYNNLRQN